MSGSSNQYVSVFLTWLVIAIVAAAWVLSIYLLFSRALQTTSVSQTAVDVTNLVVNGLLSAALVYLYTKQHNVADKQANIMRNQQELMELEFIPRLIVVDYVLQNWGAVEKPQNDIIKLSLKNEGNGAATDLHYLLNIRPIGDGVSSLNDLDTFEYSGQEWILNTGLSPLSRDDTEASGVDVFRGPALPSDAMNDFQGPIQFEATRTDGERTRNISFSKGLEVLADLGVDSVQFAVYLVYSNELNEISGDYILGGQIDDLREQDWTDKKDRAGGGLRKSESLVIEDVMERNPDFLHEM